MAYMRGEYYIWADAESWCHFWGADGYDGWDDTLWAVDEDTQIRRIGYENASGVSLPGDVADEFVVRRLFELIANDKLSTLLARLDEKSEYDDSMRRGLYILRDLFSDRKAL